MYKLAVRCTNREGKCNMQKSVKPSIHHHLDPFVYPVAVKK